MRVMRVITIVLIWIFIFNEVNSQNVGIGIATPARKLDINGDLRIRQFVTILPPFNTTHKILIANSLGDVGSLAFTGNSNDYLRGDGSWGTITGGTNDADWFTANTTNPPTNITDNIYTQGLVGIGTTVPTTPLHIEHSSPFGNTVDEAIRIVKKTTGTPASGIGTAISFHMQTNYPLQEWTRIENSLFVEDPSVYRGGYFGTTSFYCRHIYGTTNVFRQVMRIWATGIQISAKDGIDWAWPQGTPQPTRPLLWTIIIRESVKPSIRLHRVGNSTSSPGLAPEITLSASRGTPGFTSHLQTGECMGVINFTSNVLPGARIASYATCNTGGCGDLRFSTRVAGGAITERLRISDTGALFAYNLNSGVGTQLVISPTGEILKNTSSIRFKTNIKPFHDDWFKLLQIQPKQFTYKETNTNSIGYIAEELHNLGLNNLIQYDNEGKPYSIHFDRITLYLVEIIKDQEQRIKKLEEELQALKNQ